MNNKLINRRSVLKTGAITAASLILPRHAFAVGKSFLPAQKKLSLFNTHTGESLNTVYNERGVDLIDSLADINRIMRDHRTGEIESIDVELLNTLYLLSATLGANAPFHIISGYRCPETNEKLRKRSSGVAKKSMHIFGKAVDVRLPGYKLEAVRDAAIELKRGGVGYYPASGFIHLDVGPTRSWPRTKIKKA